MTRTDPHVSQFQRDVGQAMEALRMGFQSEGVLAEGYSVDLAMVERRIAIEVDGPWHFVSPDRRSGWEPTGSTVLKRRQLQALGWEVVSIPFYEWPHGEMARKEYLELVLLGQGIDIRS